jgi:hypothetical protein
VFVNGAQLLQKFRLQLSQFRVKGFISLFFHEFSPTLALVIEAKRVYLALVIQSYAMGFPQ